MILLIAGWNVVIAKLIAQKKQVWSLNASQLRVLEIKSLAF
jgi:hypothetical protein